METTARQEIKQMLASSETRSGEPLIHAVEVPMAMYDMITTGNAAALPITTKEQLFVDDLVDFISISGTIQMRIVMVMQDDPGYENETRPQRWIRKCLNAMGYANPIAVQFAYFQPVKATPKIQFELDDWDNLQAVFKWVEENADDDSDVWHWATDYLDPEDADIGATDTAQGSVDGTADDMVGDSDLDEVSIGGRDHQVAFKREIVAKERYVSTDYDGCSYITAHKAYRVIGSIGNDLLEIVDDRSDIIFAPVNCNCAHLNKIGKWRWCDSTGTPLNQYIAS